MSIAPIEFDYLRQLVREISAIEIDGSQQYLAELRLGPLISNEGCGSVQDLLGRLRGAAFGGLHQRVVDAMTNNETWFFRDCHPFAALGDEVIPELMTARARERKLSIWSAACSSGQEPYSIAMLIRDKGFCDNWQVSIRATDISTTILERARQGLYKNLEINRGLPATTLRKYFVQKGTQWELIHDIKRMVHFELMNLAQPWPSVPSADVVFLRNVLIYFDIAVRKRILSNIKRILRPDGYLFLGGAETTLNLDSDFEQVQFGKTVCHRLRKPAAN